jgi:predicted aldo/keto reductase-like oxidoreductase
VLLGAKSEAEITEALSYFSAPESERDYSPIIQGFMGTAKGGCLYCNHCQPCPSGIDIAAVTRYADIAALNTEDIPPAVIQHYRALTKHGSDCISCTSCEKKCPFGIPVIENMKKAVAFFGL